MIFQKNLPFFLNSIDKIYAFLSSLKIDETFWSALSAIGTIGAVVFSVAMVMNENKYRTKYNQKIKISSKMGVLSPFETNYYTELTHLSFEIINKTNRKFDGYTSALELKPTVYNKLVSLVAHNLGFPLSGDYEYLIEPFLLDFYKEKSLKDEFNNQAIEPLTPMNVFFDLRNSSSESDNIGWTVKSLIDQRYFSGKIRIKIVDKFGNYYYSSWHKMKHPKK